MVISINLFHLDAIDDIFFEGNVSGNSSDVTVTKEDNFTEQQKKDEGTKSTCTSETEEEQTKQQHSNKTNSDHGSIEEEVCAEQN